MTTRDTINETVTLYTRINEQNLNASQIDLYLSDASVTQVCEF